VRPGAEPQSGGEYVAAGGRGRQEDWEGLPRNQRSAAATTSLPNRIIASTEGANGYRLWCGSARKNVRIGLAIQGRGSSCPSSTTRRSVRPCRGTCSTTKTGMDYPST